MAGTYCFDVNMFRGLQNILEDLIFSRAPKLTPTNKGIGINSGLSFNVENCKFKQTCFYTNTYKRTNTFVTPNIF